MVRAFGRVLGKFRHSERGVTIIEGLITFPIVLIMITAMVEFGFAVYQWNQTVKALQLGARLAAVSDPLIDITSISDYYVDNGTVGGPAPTGAPTLACGADASACDTTQLNRLVFGVDSSGAIDDECDSNYGNVPGMCDFNPRITPANVRITYAPSGLGFVGQPGNPVVTVIVETRDLSFNLPVLGALLGINTLDIPARPVTVTSEDLSNTVP